VVEVAKRSALVEVRECTVGVVVAPTSLASLEEEPACREVVEAAKRLALEEEPECTVVVGEEQE
jgi:hypothetical protein